MQKCEILWVNGHKAGATLHKRTRCMAPGVKQERMKFMEEEFDRRTRQHIPKNLFNRK